MADGGAVRGPGTATSDSIPAMLSDGEYIIPAHTVAKFGVRFFDNLKNAGHSSSTSSSVPGQVAFATGGLVQGMGSDRSGAGGRSMPTIVMNVTSPDPQEFKKSQAQIEAQMSLALQRAKRNL
jgi:hypothetical protein